MAGFKFNITKSEYEGLDEALRENYRDLGEGKFRLILVDNPLQELRDLNAGLATQLREEAATRAKAEGLAASLGERLAKFDGVSEGDVLALRDGKKKTGKDDASLNDIVAAALRPLAEQVQSLQGTLEAEKANAQASRKKLAETRRDSELRRLAVASGVKASVVDFVLPQAAPAFDFDPESEVLVPLKRDEDNLPVTPQRFFDGLRAKAPEFFGANGGGNIDPSSASRGGTRTDGKKILMDPTDLEKGKNAEAIAKGEVIVQYSDGRI